MSADDFLTAQGPPQRRALVNRIAAHRKDWEKSHLLEPYDPKRPQPDGRLVSLFVEPHRLDRPEFVDAWLDPVGIRHPITCKKSSGGSEPCGAVWLDWTAFGAFKMVERGTLIGVVRGTHTVDGVAIPSVRVLVRNADHATIGVAPEWDGGK